MAGDHVERFGRGRLLIAVVVFLTLVVARVPLTAGAGEHAAGPGEVPYVPLGVCDLPGAGSGTEAECRRTLISPQNADVVEVESEGPSATGIAPVDAASAPVPASSLDEDPVFGTSGEPTGPTAHANLANPEAKDLFIQANGSLLMRSR